MRNPQIFANMSKHDKEVFATYLFTPEGQSYDAWEFNVLTGRPNDPGRYYPAAQRKAALYQNALKIDAIGWFVNTPTIIEAKPTAGLPAIGQGICYRQWYRAHFGVEPSVIIVCSHMADQVKENATWSNIQLRIVPPANDFMIRAAVNYVTPLIQRRSVIPVIASALGF
jgi:hypothetical protein